MSSIITSRRSFLKLFGATAAALALPTQQFEVLAPQPILRPRQSLPPGLLHVFDGGDWKAITEIRSLSLRQNWEPIFVDFDHGPARFVKGTREFSVEFTGFYHPGLDLLENIFAKRQFRQYAFSVSDTSYKFEAFMKAWRHEFDGLGEPSVVAAELDIAGDVKLEILEE